MLRRIVLYALLSMFCFAITGCATQKPSDVRDPYEVMNRATFAFNKKIDNVIVKPVAYLYLKYLPQPFQLGIGNFFNNLREITNVANDVLQLKFRYASYDLSRFLVNSTLGIGGIFDVANALGMEHRKEDFGQTLYHWGYHNSAYFIIPFIGPSTVRDAIGMGVDYYALSIWPWIENDWEKYALLGVDFLDIRAGLLRRESVLDVLAVDEYVFMRDAYFQHRQYLFNGSSEEEIEELDGSLDLEHDYFPQKVEKGRKAEKEHKVEEQKKAKEEKVEKALPKQQKATHS